MKAYVFSKKGIVEKREIPDAVLKNTSSEDVFAAILKPVYLSPCSSDVHTVFSGNGPRRKNLVLGHEGIAEVLETGSGVKDFKPGDLVAVSAVMPEKGDIAGHKGMPFSASKLGRNIDGMWAERFKVPMADINLSHIPGGLSMESALMACDMMATGFTAAKEADIREDSTVLIIGSGAVGLMAAAAAMESKAWRIYIIGTDKSKINAGLARQYGVDAYISYRDGGLVFGDEAAKEALTAWENNKTAHKDIRANSTKSAAVETVFALTGGEGVDRALICGGGNEALMQACDAVRYGSGAVVNVSYIEGTGDIGLPIFSLGRGMCGKSFKFCLSRGGRNWTEKMLKTALDMEKQSAFSQMSDEAGAGAGALVTHHLKGFDAIPEGLELMKKRPAGLIKVMIETKL